MQKKLCVLLAMLLVVTGLLFTVSCAKKTITSDASLTQLSEEEAARQRAEEAARQRDATIAKQRALEEERLDAGKRNMLAARNMFINQDIYFDFDRSDLLSEAQAVLKQKAAWLRNNPNVSATIEGHCDERGTNEYNLALGDRRAANAKSFLMDLGISGSRLRSISYGEERPLDSMQNNKAWAKNRRVHFVIE